MAVDFDWEALPDDLRDGLLLGGSGKQHLSSLASLAMSSPRTARLGLDLLSAAWEGSPLDGGLARTLVALDARAAFLSPGVRRAARACAENWAVPEGSDQMAALAASRRHGELPGFLAGGFRREPRNLFWRQHLLDLAYLLGEWDMALEAARAPWPDGLEAAREKCLGDIAFQNGGFEEARARYAQAAVLRPARFRLGQSLFRLGRDAEAAVQWRKALRAAPWNVDTLCRLHDSLAGLDRPGPPLSGKVAVCLYTYGKARELDATLHALFASDLGNAAVLALDNGGAGGVPELLAGWKDRAGEALDVISLPVNVGAPAARNWLMRHPRAAGSDFVAYLDDDALVPPDWRGRFAQAVRACPGAGVWGAKVVDLAHPGRVQHAEINLLPGAGPVPAFSAPCAGDLDFGQWDRVRACLSVTGCFHLFRTASLMECGDFDIRFSPTQYDDLDHDLRLASMGKPPVCQGHLTVRHARLSGALLHQDACATGNSEGNLRKLAAKHPYEERESLRREMASLLLEDAKAKAAACARAWT
ncbi:MAG: glycosyltransferase [Thermodesulfobacteriota bacterium]